MADRLRRTPSTASRRTLERPSSVASSSRDVFSDEHAYDDAMVADGFRPAEMTTITPPRQPRPTPFLRQQQPQPPLRPAEDTKPEKRPSMLGAGATIVSRNSFSLRHDATDAPRRRESTRTEMSQRPNSVISTFSLPSAQSPYIGASGPSHPYGMYPQDTSLNRSSTVGSTRPAHPYGMYPQATNADLAGSADIASIGFPGLGRTYARRLGPDGEDADDIIGPDGHTEQLPPYTRYADGQPRHKEQYAPSMEAPPSEDTTAVPESPGEALLASSDASTAVTEEGAPPTPKWQQKGKRRYFGGRVPAWLIWLGLLLLLITSATLGGVIGRGMRTNGRDGSDQRQKTLQDPGADTVPTSVPTSIISVTTTLIDASPIATPGNLPSLPAGQFQFGLAAASQSSSGCLEDPREAGSGAWACSDEGSMVWTVQKSDIRATQVVLTGQNQDGRLEYGPQPPSMPGPIGLDLVTDVEQPGLGPAFFFQSLYTKQVILPEAALNQSKMQPRELGARVRGAFNVRSKLHARDARVEDEDKPWVCYWNNTLIEGFIYVKEPAGAAPSSAASLPSAPPPPSAAASSSSAAATTAPARLRARWKHHHFGGDSDGATEKQAVHKYPFPMKIVERRASKALDNPYCQQMQKILKDGDPFSMKPVLNNGKPNIIMLTESDPLSQDLEGQQIAQGGDPSAGQDQGLGPGPDPPAPPRRTVRKRADDACVCQWMAA